MKRKLIRTSIVLFVLLGLPLIGWRAFLAVGINKKEANIRKAGLPTSGEELNRWYAPVPDAQNGALVMTQAFALRRLYPDSRTNLIFNFKLPRRGVKLSAEESELLRGYVALNEERMRKADKALKFTKFRYPMNCAELMNTPLPHLTWLVDIVELHQFSGALALESGNTRPVVTNITSMLALTRTLDAEPLTISQLVRLRLLSMAFDLLERRVAASPFDADEIEKLSGAFAQVQTTNLLAMSMVGERAMTMPYFRMSREELEKLHPAKDPEHARKNSIMPCHGPVILKLLGYYELDYGTYLTVMERAIELMNNEPPDNLRVSGYLHRVGEKATKRGRTLSGNMFSSMARTVERENQGMAHQRLAITALAIEGFRNEHGKLPEELEELVPKYLEEIFDDPFTVVELEYERKEQGYVIYSIGPDREDNGGLGKADKKQSDDKQSYDITFTVER